jgi:collagen type III alpha
LRFVKGDHIKEFSLRISGQIYRGVWKSDVQYAVGDNVTYDGSCWVAEADTMGEKPGNGKTAWKLAVKAGRDGRDGTPGAKGEKGDTGRPGRDLTLMTGQ